MRLTSQTRSGVTLSQREPLCSVDACSLTLTAQTGAPGPPAEEPC